MRPLIPASLHRALYRVAFRARVYVRRVLKLPISGVSAVLRDGEGHLLLVRHSYGPPGWALPGGGCGRGEDPHETVRRELREELGLEIAQLELLATLEEKLSGAPHTAFVFAGLASGEPVPDGREIVEARFFPPGQLPPRQARPSRGGWRCGPHTSAKRVPMTAAQAERPRALIRASPARPVPAPTASGPSVAPAEAAASVRRATYGQWQQIPPDRRSSGWPSANASAW